MADEAFALSPISARATQPSEEDYAAIHEAFMETSRGRWFLGEYAKRNRNADTRLVLDAVARIEDSLAAQKQATADADLTEALAAIRAAVTEAQASASAGIDGLALDERMAPIARGVRIIREISWRWRETGADGRICDILDSQVAAIESSTGQISVAEARAAIDQAFAAIEARIGEYSRDEAAPVEARRDAQDANAGDANVVPFPAPAEEASEPEAASAAVAETVAETAVAEIAEAPVPEIAEATAAAIVEPVAEATSPIAAVVGAIEAVDEATADAHDEAVLDLIAAEMSAPMDDETAIAETAMAEPQAVEPAAVADEAIAASVEPVVAPAVQPEPPAAVATATDAVTASTQIGEADVSIGSAVIASGILSKPNRPANDPLAPIRRMSQAEKIAFFS
ncbi:hypothetical protein [Bradyrhizobium sp.]|uniref:hypothetical protein n=1 Tax=Bradyrhizobium sp. TaxID=376 RepID=UPI001E140205|nr:hypothetical protein [Bradyrhizobium sp.]MBI5320998.1 hypothetical protein [Bradyrhizobium sp.]